MWYGTQILMRRFVMDFSLGLGMRFRHIVHEDKIYSGDRMISPRHPNVHYQANSEKKDIALNIPMNIRLGFRF